MILGCLLRMEEEWRSGQRPWKTALDKPWRTSPTSHGAAQTRAAKLHKQQPSCTQLASKSTSPQSRIRADQSQDYISVADHGSTEARSPTDLLARARAVEARTKDMKSTTRSSVHPRTASVLNDLLNFNGSIACKTPTTHAQRPRKSPFRQSASETPEVCTSETLESGMPKSISLHFALVLPLALSFPNLRTRSPAPLS
jgi:hypothetical protein